MNALTSERLAEIRHRTTDPDALALLAEVERLRTALAGLTNRAYDLAAHLSAATPGGTS